MEEFFTWGILGTYAGATLATTLLTQLLKEAAGIKKIPTKLLSFLIAVLVLIAEQAFMSTLTLSSGVLAVINGALVSLAANGAFDAVAAKKKE